MRCIVRGCTSKISKPICDEHRSSVPNKLLDLFDEAFVHYAIVRARVNAIVLLKAGNQLLPEEAEEIVKELGS